MKKNKIKLSHSKISDFNKCKRYYKYKYIDKITPKKRSIPLHFGSIFHQAVQDLYQKKSVSDIQKKIKKTISEINLVFYSQKDIDNLAWTETVLCAAISAWNKRFYKSDIEKKYKIVELERKHPNINVTNPKTNRKSKYIFSFISDAIFRIKEKLWLVEYKTASRLGNEYFRKLSIDQQISAYINFIQEIKKENVEGVLYRILKKPSIKQKKTETKQQFLLRLEELFENQSEDYLIEEKIYRNYNEISEFKKDLYQTALLINETEKKDFYPRNTNSCTNFGECEFFSICNNEPNAYIKFMKKEEKK